MKRLLAAAVLALTLGLTAGCETMDWAENPADPGHMTVPDRIEHGGQEIAPLIPPPYGPVLITGTAALAAILRLLFVKRASRQVIEGIEGAKTKDNTVDLKRVDMGSAGKRLVDAVTHPGVVKLPI